MEEFWSTVAGYDYYLWDFSQSEMEKYFEWIIIVADNRSPQS